MIQRVDPQARKFTLIELQSCMAMMRENLEDSWLMVNSLSAEILALRQENERLKVELQQMKIDQAPLQSRQASKTFHGKSIE